MILNVEYRATPKFTLEPCYFGITEKIDTNDNIKFISESKVSNEYEIIMRLDLMNLSVGQYLGNNGKFKMWELNEKTE